MHIIGIHKVLRRLFHGVKCPGYRDLNKCQIPAHPGLNSCQMPGGCPGGMGTLGFDSYIMLDPFFSRVGPSPPERSEERRKNGARTGLDLEKNNFHNIYCNRPKNRLIIRFGKKVLVASRRD